MKPFTNFMLYSLLFLLSSLSFSAQASMSLNKIILDFVSGQEMRDDIEITNPDDEPLYVNATLYEVINPESDKPEKKEITDLKNSPVLVSPMRLIIAPKQQKIVRVIVRDTAKEKDKVYRLRIVPVAGEVNLTGIDETKKEKVTGVKVMVGYEMLIFVRPPQPNADLKAERVGNILKLSNEGNTNLDVREIQQCNDKNECVEIKAKRLYAGQKWQGELPQPNNKVAIRYSVGMEFKALELDK